MNLALKLLQAVLNASCHLCQRTAIQMDAYLLHLHENPGERQLHILEEIPHAQRTESLFLPAGKRDRRRRGLRRRQSGTFPRLKLSVGHGRLLPGYPPPWYSRVRKQIMKKVSPFSRGQQVSRYHGVVGHRTNQTG